MNENVKIIGVGGFARAGKDMFVQIAQKILKENGYSGIRLAFADALKDDLDAWVKEKYGISVYTQNDAEKNILRPIMVAHGCQKRVQTEGKYWVDKLATKIDQLKNHDFPLGPTVYLVSDVRFVNEADWIHSLGGWVVHLRKYRNKKWPFPLNFLPPRKDFDNAPNAEEAKNDPLLTEVSDYHLDLQQVLTNKNSAESVLDNSYLNEEIKLCLTQCPFLTIRTS